MELIAARIREVFAKSVGIDAQALFAAPITLSDLMTRSPTLTNSVDLMEAFAKTASVVKREFGVRVRLPALPLDTPLDQVLATFMDEVAKAAVTRDTLAAAEPQ